MTGDGADNVGRIVARFELLQRVARVAGVRVRIALVIEVMDETGDGPFLLVLSVPLGVGAHRRLDPEHMLSERVGLDPLAHKVPCFNTRRFSHDPLLP